MDATKTSRNSWKEPLSQALRKSRKVAFVGVGQELRGDDAAGVLVVRRLMESARKNPSKSKVTESQREAPLLFEAGPLPEAATGALRRYLPDWAVFIDSAEMGEPPGTIRWVDPEQAEGFTGSTHTFPISGLGKYLSSELGCRVAILGIQPKNLEFDSPVSEEVDRTIEEIVAFINTSTKPAPR
ncbi:MAG: hydrogenase 3 maturation endopeptidase HyCI [Anaerolineales bacterium]